MRIALITDFGTRDPYAAAMKGVITGRTTALVHDLTHDIAPFDVLEGAWFLRSCVRYWPDETIFVAVVDPGVGSPRRIVAATQDEHTFLAPDNGLLSLVLRANATLISVENPAHFLPDQSTTFHGRDRFAPVAAAIANGLRIEELGPRIESIVRLRYEEPIYAADYARGTIVAIDRFGNLITDLVRAQIPFESMTLQARGVIIDRLERTYAGAEAGPFLIVGSSGCIEISVANGSAAERLQMRRLDRVEVWRSEGRVPANAKA
jgi:S-adenosylmethionine hydrolase